MTEPTKIALDKIVDVFSCADGGVDFIKFKIWLEGADERFLADKTGDSATTELVLLIHRFAALVTIVTR